MNEYHPKTGEMMIYLCTHLQLLTHPRIMTNPTQPTFSMEHYIYHHHSKFFSIGSSGSSSISIIMALLILFLFLCTTTTSGMVVSISSSSAPNSSSTSSSGTTGYVRDACSVTRYQDLCMHSLASFSHFAKRSPSRWARAAVSVTIGETKVVAHHITNSLKRKKRRGREGVALSDCAECFRDALDELHLSLGVLRRLRVPEFQEQMGDLTTWLSAALTEAGTCLDGFEDGDGNSMNDHEYLKGLRSRVLNVSYMTSNALALVNKLASTGLDDTAQP